MTGRTLDTHRSNLTQGGRPISLHDFAALCLPHLGATPLAGSIGTGAAPAIRRIHRSGVAAIAFTRSGSVCLKSSLPVVGSIRVRLEREHRRRDFTGGHIGDGGRGLFEHEQSGTGISRAIASPLPTGKNGSRRPSPRARGSRTRAGACASAACSRVWRTPCPSGSPSAPRAPCRAAVPDRSEVARARPGSLPRISAPRAANSATAARSAQSGMERENSRFIVAATSATIRLTPMPARFAGRSSSSRARPRRRRQDRAVCTREPWTRRWSRRRNRAGHSRRRGARRFPAPAERIGPREHGRRAGEQYERRRRVAEVLDPEVTPFASTVAITRHPGS